RNLTGSHGDQTYNQRRAAPNPTLLPVVWLTRNRHLTHYRGFSGQPSSFAPSTAASNVNRWVGSVAAYPVSCCIRSRRYVTVRAPSPSCRAVAVTLPWLSKNVERVASSG